MRRTRVADDTRDEAESSASGAPTAPVRPEDDPVVSLVTDLEGRGVLVLDRRPVLAFLRAHPDLLPVVKRVADVAIERLGDRSELSLEVYRDPEVRSKKLILYARQSPYEGSLLDVIHEIMDNHWQLAPGATGWFQLMTDYQRPRRS
jgi:hypothetical protein